MLDLTKPLRTLKGYPVGLISVDTDQTYALKGFVQYPNENQVLSWTLEGKFLAHGATDHSMNLVNTEPDMLDLTKPVQTRNGMPVRLLCTDANSRFPVTGLISPPGRDVVGTWTMEGRYRDNSCESRWDLVNVPVRHNGWINIRMVEGKLATPLLRASQLYSTRAEADIHARPSRIACVFVSFAEGEGL